MVAIAECEAVRNELMESSPFTAADLGSVSLLPGLYVIWVENADKLCLKVGIAGPRRKDGLRGRLRLHFSSNPDNSVLARHMIADATPAWAHEFNFRTRAERAAFLKSKCCFRTLELRGIDEVSLRSIESSIEDVLRPRYCSRVGQRRAVSTPLRQP